jgi:hypothetical protein
VEFALRNPGAEFISFFDVVVDEVSPGSRVKYMAFVREAFKTSLAESKRLVDSIPWVIARGVGESAALRLRSEHATAGANVSIRLVRQERNPDFGFARSDRLLVRGHTPEDLEVAIRGPRTGVTGEFSLSQQACGICAAEGCLVASPEEVPRVCPRCGGKIVESGSWVT